MTYVPDRDYSGPDSFAFIVNDGVANSEHATVELRVRPVNDPPRAEADRFDAQPDEAFRIPVSDLLGNDVEVDSEPLTITNVRANHAGATVVLDGSEVVFTPPPGWASQTQYAFFDYTITDGAGESSTAWVYIRVNHGPAAPHCANRSLDVPHDQTLAVTLACTDKNRDPLSYAIVSDPQEGTAQLGSGGALTYTPPAGFVGTTSLRFKASDGTLESLVATVTIRVLPDNAAPVCSEVSVNGSEDSPTEVTLTCTDSDGDPLGFDLLGQPGHGTLERLAEGRYRYTPQADWSGEDGFSFRATDAYGASAPAAARIVLSPVNDAPVVTDHEVVVAEDAGGVAVDLALRAADLETADAALDYVVVGQPAKGTLTGSGATRTYTPRPDANGADSFTFRVRDRGDPDDCAAGAGCSDARASELATIRVTIEARNDLPVCRDLALSVEHDSAGDVQPDCSDVDGDPLAHEIASQGAKGQATLAGGRLRFTPTAGQHGEDSFQYAARDAAGQSQPARVSVTIRAAAPVNRAPAATDDALDTDEDTPLVIALSQLTSNDTDPDGDALTVTDVSGAAHGTVSLSAGNVTFRPDPDFHGQARFAYTIHDPNTANDTATATITVRPVNDAPVVTDHEVVVAEDASGVAIDLALRAADLETADAALDYVVVGQPAKGTLTGSGATRTYTPRPDANGADSFTFRVRDRGDPDDCAAGAGCSDARASELATIRVTIEARNDLPVCRDLALSVEHDSAGDVQPDCSDVDGDPLAHEIASQGAKGQATLAGGRLRFTPTAGQHGEDSFQYAARDAAGQSQPARVSVTIRAAAPVNRAPAATDDALDTDEDTPLVIALSQLTSNDTDPDGDALTVTDVSGAAHGTVSLSAGNVTFRPDPDFHGQARFAYTIHDPNTANDTATATITVRPVNDAPVAAGDEVETQADTPITLARASLLANDRDVDGDPLTVSGVADPVHGEVTIDDDAVRFTPETGFRGVAGFTYAISDGRGGADRATVSVLVAPVTGSSLLLGCARRPVVLEDVIPGGRRVRLLGVADGSYIGSEVEIRFAATGQVVARATVDPDGRFTATAPMPAIGLRSTNRARYVARIGTQRSPSLKLMRRMRVLSVHASAGTVTIAGWITGPLARHRKDRGIDVRRQTCTTSEVVARVRPDADGRFSATFAAPAEGRRSRLPAA